MPVPSVAEAQPAAGRSDTVLSWTIAQADSADPTDLSVDETLDLQLGDTDPRVIVIQERLKVGGYYDGEPSEIFDITTDLSVTRFQESQGLEPTGVVDLETWESLQDLAPMEEGRTFSLPSSSDGVDGEEDAVEDLEEMVIEESVTEESAGESAGETVDESGESETSDETESGEPSSESAPETDTAPEAEEESPQRRSSFSRLMLWLSASIAAIGIVGFLFYWLLRTLDGNSDEPDIDDFDDLDAAASDVADLEELEEQESSELAGRSLALTPPPEESEQDSPAAAIAKSESQPSLPPTPQPAVSHAPPVEEAVAMTSLASLPPVESVPPETALPETSLPETATPQAASPETASPPAPQIEPDRASNSVPNPELSIATTGPEVLSLPTTPTDVPKLSITESLLQDLYNSDPNQRKQAIWELGRRGDSRAIQPLVDLMRRSDSQERSLILAVLTEINARSLQPMEQALALSFQDESPEVRKNALRDLTRIFDAMTQMGYFINKSTFDRDPDVRETAVWALEQLKYLNSATGVDRLPPDDREAPNNGRR